MPFVSFRWAHPVGFGKPCSLSYMFYPLSLRVSIPLFLICGLQEFIDRYGVLAPLVVENAYRNCAQVRRRGEGGGRKGTGREGLTGERFEVVLA